MNLEDLILTSDGIVDILSNKLISQLETIKNIKFEEVDVNNGVASKIKHTKSRGLDVYYEDTNHVYYVVNNGERLPLISVTTLIGLFNPPFNSEEMAINCALKYDYNANYLDKTNWETIGTDERKIRILKAWKENNKIATEYGSAVHMCCEYLANDIHKDLNEIISKVIERCGDVMKDNNMVYNFLLKFRKFLLYYKSLGYEIITEPVVVDLIIGVAGQTDLVLINHNTKHIIVVDHKTNAINPIEEKSYDKMRGFFKFMDSNSYHHYCIQIPYYGKMLKETYPDYTIDNNAQLLWFNPDDQGYRILTIDMVYWGNVINNMRNYFINNKISQQVYDRIKKYKK